jgi:hypothetical protein
MLSWFDAAVTTAGDLAPAVGNPDRRSCRFVQSLRLCTSQAFRWGGAQSLAGLSAVCVVDGQLEQAVQLLGGAPRPRGPQAIPVPTRTTKTCSAAWNGVISTVRALASAQPGGPSSPAQAQASRSPRQSHSRSPRQPISNRPPRR